MTRVISLTVTFRSFVISLLVLLVLLVLTFAVGSDAWAAFSSAGVMNTVRRVHTATLLPNGKVLVAGGYNTNVYFSAEEVYDQAANSWSATGSMDAERQNHTATLLPNGKVLVAGGYNGIFLSSAEVYDPVTNSWSAGGSMHTARSWHTATLLPNGKVLVAGGDGSVDRLSTVELYDPATNSWSVAGSMSTARSYHTATLLPNGNVLVAGGFNGTSFPAAELYDPTTNRWSAAGALSTVRYSHTATLLPNGKVMVAGGYNNSFYVSTVEVYDPVINSWSAAGTLSDARFNHTATLLPNGKVMVAGGYNNIGGSLSTVEVYDPATSSWSAGGVMSAARSYHTATLLPNGKVLMAGGYDSTNNGSLSSTEVYDSSTNIWSAAGAMNAVRSGHTASLLPSGKVLVAGGVDGGGLLATAEVYDPATVNWSAAGSMSAERLNHTATLLPSGKVLVIGGMGTSTVEVYDPVTNSWSAAGALSAARYHHTATLLPSGKVLVAGGTDGGGSLATAEVYDPATNNWSAAGSMSAERLNHTATLLPSGKVLVTGGMGTSTVEVYDPVTNSWSAAGALSAARYHHTATLLPSGKVLVAGGEDGGGLFATAEVYESLALADSRRPVVAQISGVSYATDKVGYLLTGTGFTGDSEASGGGTNNASAGVPLFSLRRIDNEQTFLVGVYPGMQMLTSGASLGWSATEFYSDTLVNLPKGQYLATLIASGVPSVGQVIPIPPDTDADGIADGADNCPSVANSTQDDYDNNGIGDLCEPCPAGALFDGTKCVACSAGKYQDQTGQTICIDAPVGGYVNATGATAYTLCAPGTYQNQTGQTSCAACPAETYASGSGSTECATCPAGTSQSDIGAMSCYADFDDDGIADVNDPDDDNDGISDVDETANGTDPLNGYIPPVATVTLTDTLQGGTVLADWSAYADPADRFAVYVSPATFTSVTGLIPFRTVMGTTRTLTIAGLTDNVPAYVAVVPISSGNQFRSNVTAASVTPTRQGVAGIVTDAATGKALSGIVVSVTGEGSTATDLNGQYVLTGIPAGSYTLEAGEAGGSVLFVTGSYGITIPAASVLTQNITLNRLAAWAPATPQNLTGTPDNGKALLTWDAVTAVDLAGYYVYRDSAKITPYAVLTNSYLDTGLTNGAAYSYRVTAINQAGAESAPSNPVSVTPVSLLPTPPTDLRAVLNCDRTVTVTWAASATADVTGYVLYSNDTLSATWTTTDAQTFSWTSVILNPDAWYLFALKAQNALGQDNGTTQVKLYVPANFGAPLAEIDIPKAGKRVDGNNLHVQANVSTCGSSGVTAVRFQYRPTGTGPWSDIPAALAEHPNPDLSAPYFTKWDVTPLAEGNYDLRAVATAGTITDDNPQIITLTIDHHQPEFTEDRAPGGGQSGQGLLAKTRDNHLEYGTNGHTAPILLVLTGDSLQTDDVILVEQPVPEVLTDKLNGKAHAGTFVDVSLLSGQTQFAAGSAPTITLPYADADNDGIVDGLNVSVNSLYLVVYNPANNSWELLENVVHDPINHTLTGTVPHFSLFGLLAEHPMPPCGVPASLTVPATSGTGSYAVTWGTSATAGVTYYLQEATDAAFTTNVRWAYSGTETSASISGRLSGKIYYYRVRAQKAGYTASAYLPAGNGCVVTITCAVPASINVPVTNATGSYAVTWSASTTAAVTYYLQEATNATFTTGVRWAYTGTGTSAGITGRSTGKSYYYRVRAQKVGYTASAYLTAGNGCAVALPCAMPASLSVPVTNSTGSYDITWGASATAGANYYLQEATNVTFTTGLRQVYFGTGTTASVAGRASGKTYYYRVRAQRAGYTASAFRTAGNGCAVTLPCAAPASLSVPASDADGSYTVSWGASATVDANYYLQEATNASFTTGLREVYFGTETTASITGRSPGKSYYYRVRAQKSGYTASAFLTAGNGCLVIALGSEPIDPGATFTRVQNEIFTPTCAKIACHDSLGRQSGLLLTAGNSYANLVNVPSAENPSLMRGVALDPANSYLYRKITGAGITGERMPQSLPPLSDAQIKLIRDWIRRGVPND